MSTHISVPPQLLLERILTLEIVRVTERAAVSAARLRGHGNEKAADQAAVDAMRRELNKLPIEGTVVIGEGERDEAPMLYIGEKVGMNAGPQVDIAGMATALPELLQFISAYPSEFRELAEINMKYEGYIQKEREMVEKMNRLESMRLLEDFDYRAISSLSAEARDKLSRHRPRTIGQASRISGVSPADVSVLLIHLGR